jgi:hypothetical protein
VFWVAIGLLFVASSWSPKQLGIRYLLPAYLAVPILAAVVAPALGRRSGPVVLVLCVVGQAYVASSSGPYWLSYLNQPASLYGRADEYFRGADVDWGQGLPALAVFLHHQGEFEALVFCQGSADPADYGICRVPWGEYPRRSCRYAAVSVLAWDHSAFAGVPPDRILAGCLCVYNMSDPAHAERAARQARLTP